MYIFTTTPKTPDSFQMSSLLEYIEGLIFNDEKTATLDSKNSSININIDRVLTNCMVKITFVINRGGVALETRKYAMVLDDMEENAGIWTEKFGRDMSSCNDFGFIDDLSNANSEKRGDIRTHIYKKGNQASKEALDQVRSIASKYDVDIEHLIISITYIQKMEDSALQTIPPVSLPVESDENREKKPVGRYRKYIGAIALIYPI